VNAAVAELAAADASLAAHTVALRSLAPGRASAHTLVEILGPRLADAAHGMIEPFVAGTAAFVRALLESFPDNLLWDLDLPLATWWRTAAASDDPAATAADLLALATELQGLFGRTTALRFRYAHDFLYGYDWAKWVGRDPAAREGIGPYDRRFLAAMRARGHELLALIEAGGDAKYPALPDASPRNPFPFSREPEAELAIHRALAEVGRIPVPAWRWDNASVTWSHPWAAWREETAAGLGLATTNPDERAPGT